MNKTDWPKVTSENYFSNEMNKFDMGSTQFKSFIPQFGGCELAAMAQLEGKYSPKKSDAFLEGSYGHSWNDGTIEEFRLNHPEMFSSRGATKGQLKTNFKKIGAAIEILESDTLCMSALEGEKELIFTAELFGMPWKIAIDSYNSQNNRFADLKFLKALRDKKWNDELDVYENVYQAYGYFLQLSLYSEIERVANNRTTYFEPLLVIATKEEVPDKCVMSFSSTAETHEDFIKRHLALASTYADRVRKVKHEGAEPIGCGVCDYCKSIKKLTGTTHYSAFELY